MEDRMENDFRSNTGSTAGGAREKVREKAAEVAGKAKEQIEGRYDEQKGRALSEVNQLASALRRAGNDLSGEGGIGSTLLGRVAGHLESLGTTMDGKNLDDIVNDVERLARRNPAMFLGGAMLIGFAASRFLKSSGRNDAYGRGFESGLEYSGSGDFRRDFYDRGSDLDTGFGTSSGARSDLETSGIGTTGRSGIGTTGSTGTGSTGFETTGNTKGGRTSGGSGTGSSGNLGGL
jgi:uncharacterized protein YjbJ (UPF0337 family)